MRALFRVLALALALASVVGGAAAHDTWFERGPPASRGELTFALGTGTRFPAREFPVLLEQLKSSGCRGDGVRAESLRWAGDSPAALLLRSARPLPPGVALSCWAQLVPIDIEIDNATVEVYLDEIKALPAVRERWAALRARGVRWQETYVKHARTEIGAEGATGAVATAAIAGLGMDARLEAAAPPRAGDTLRFQLLRDGQPLSGLPVELRSELSPLGLWRKTDGDGRVEITLPLAGRWLLRGTDVRPSATAPDRWDSRFVTLAFELRARSGER